MNEFIEPGYIKVQSGKNRSASKITCPKCNEARILVNSDINKRGNKFNVTCQDCNNATRRVDVNCAYCSKERTIRKSQYAKSKTGMFFCNKTCQGLARKIDSGDKFSEFRNDKYYDSVRTSDEEKAIKAKQRYIKNRDNTNQYRPKITSEKMKKDLSLWRSGIAGDYEPESTSSGKILKGYYRKFFFNENNNQCSECRLNLKNEYSGNSILEIHHRDGNTKNNKFENLQLLCPNCHSLTLDFNMPSKDISNKNSHSSKAIQENKPCKKCGENFTGYCRYTYCENCRIRNPSLLQPCHLCSKQTYALGDKPTCAKCEIVLNHIEKFYWSIGVVAPSKASGSSGKLKGPFREFMLKESNYSCSKCGWSKVHELTGKVPITIDHIDGNNKNNLYSNLRVLCRNCHALTPTYKGLNRNKVNHL